MKRLMDDRRLKDKTRKSYEYCHRKLSEYCGKSDFLVDEVNLAFVKGFLSWCDVSDETKRGLCGSIASVWNYAIDKRLVDGYHTSIIHTLDRIEGDASGVVPCADGLIEFGHRKIEVNVRLQTTGSLFQVVLGNLEVLLQITHGVALFLSQFNTLLQGEQIGISTCSETDKCHAECYNRFHFHSLKVENVKQ